MVLVVTDILLGHPWLGPAADGLLRPARRGVAAVDGEAVLAQQRTAVKSQQPAAHHQGLPGVRLTAGVAGWGDGGTPDYFGA